MAKSNLFKVLGPGLLYAGAAVGVSHLVQSTRAGAGYGFDLLWILIIANVLKYPFFEFGHRFASVTGKTLIEGYRQIGKWAIVLFALLTLATMFSIQAAITIVTAGLAANIFHINLNPTALSAVILCITLIILIFGKFKALDKVIKFVIVLLAVSTLVAVFSAIGKGYQPNPEFAQSFSWTKSMDIFFLIAFVGWMPAPIDVSVWQSLWSVEKQKSLNFKPALKDSLLDFKIGYFGTAFLAISFLTLGAYVLYGSGEELSASGVLFADQLINMYTSSIGQWAYYFVAIAAFTTMFSTTITCLDAYPRVMNLITYQFMPKLETRKIFHNWFWIILTAAGAVLIMTILSDSMRTLVDIATTLSFVTAPLIALLNYRVVTSKNMPIEDKPALWLKAYAWIGIIFLGGFTVVYLMWKYLF